MAFSTITEDISFRGWKLSKHQNIEGKFCYHPIGYYDPILCLPSPIESPPQITCQYSWMAFSTMYIFNVAQIILLIFFLIIFWRIYKKHYKTERAGITLPLRVAHSLRMRENEV
uniref:Uncharacterized protein n=1 Tax=Meloidogyne incognita TaxID=6306 RepID=A0A914MRE2_MELIC